MNNVIHCVFVGLCTNDTFTSVHGMEHMKFINFNIIILSPQ